MLRQVDPLQATAWAVLGGTLFLLPFGAREIATSPPPDVTPAAVLGILYSGAFAAAVANVLVFNAIRLVGPSRVTVSQFLVPGVWPWCWVRSSSPSRWGSPRWPAAR